jgi:hypothetical protein
MTKIIGGKKFEPMDSANVDNNSLFLDQSDMKIKQKDNSGSVTDLSGGFEKYTLVQTLTPSGSGQDITLEVGKRYAITVDLTPVSGEGLYDIRINSDSSSVYNYARIFSGDSSSASSANDTPNIIVSGTNLKAIIKCGALSNASDSNYYFSIKIESFGNSNSDPGENVLVGSYETGISSSTYVLNLINNMTGTIKVYEVEFL